ncbi:hypothetical protein LA02_881 [Francisella philomiragia]|uniref:glycosyltransferase family 61 protein n=1 Tax=Francisella philomiragia TaxID=28110 RepID=UPI0005A5699A|nr:glycosyltransferase family 61 protein [Francisella philomiragia]AJI56203.1 hypothetical protein LA02_881 [Francisella philomiragia]
MKENKLLRIIYRSIPKFIRQQFLNDPITAFRENNTIQDNTIENNNIFHLVKGVEELGCEYKLISQQNNRKITMAGATLVIDSKEYSKCDINTYLPDISIYKVNNVSIVGRTSLLLNNDLFYSFDLNTMQYFHEIKRQEVVIKNIDGSYTLNFKRTQKIECSTDKTYVHLLDDYSHNYYHFMVEVLPRFTYTLDILMQDSNFDLANYIFLIDSRVSEQNIATLRAIAGDSIIIQKVVENEEFFCQKLIYCSPLSFFLENNKNPPSIAKDIVIDEKALKEARDKILNKINIAPFKTFKSKKIYLQRISEYRKITNINDLELLLHKEGFEFVNTGGMLLEEQISLFQHADIVIGASGASFTNILFMKPNTKVINIYPSVSSTNYNIFQPLASITGVDLVHFLTKPVDDSSFIHAPSTVDIKALEIYLSN